MTFPNKIKIGGHEYKIVFHKTTALCEADGGSTDRNTGLIEIDSTMIQSEQEAVFFHEIFHVINRELDHELLDSLSQQFYQVLKDNDMLK